MNNVAVKNQPRNGSVKGPSLRDIMQSGKGRSLAERVSCFAAISATREAVHRQKFYMRRVASPADREVKVIDPFTDKVRRMLMFGSNNYLGLANHPYVCEQVCTAVKEYGVGIGGPPLLNGYTNLHHALKERLSTLKNAEDTLLFPTGYGANIGLISGLVNEQDVVLFDAYSHASFYDGVRMTRGEAIHFQHNDMSEAAALLEQCSTSTSGDTFLGVEGVYSMDGDLAPLDQIIPLCKRYGAILIVDDAHGTGVMGRSGKGTAEHFGVEGQVDITMATFSKTFGVVGGFVSASKPIIDYLRFFARSYMFSASLPPVIVAAVLAGLDVIENEPWRLARLRENVRYTVEGLRSIGIDVDTQAAIIALRVPCTINMAKAAYHFQKAGIFLNSIEYPAVPVDEQRFRISIMATHTTGDLDRLIGCVEEVWSLQS